MGTTAENGRALLGELQVPFIFHALSPTAVSHDNSTMETVSHAHSTLQSSFHLWWGRKQAVRGGRTHQGFLPFFAYVAAAAAVEIVEVRKKNFTKSVVVVVAGNFVAPSPSPSLFSFLLRSMRKTFCAPTNESRPRRRRFSFDTAARWKVIHERHQGASIHVTSKANWQSRNTEVGR